MNRYSLNHVGGRFEAVVTAGDGTPFAKISDLSRAEVCRLMREYFRPDDVAEVADFDAIYDS